MGRARVNAPEGDERTFWAERFHVSLSQIDHDRAISHLLSAFSGVAGQFVFFGGTALARTVLPDLRLSEDIDLLSIGARRPVAESLDLAIQQSRDPALAGARADPWLSDARKDTEACILHLGDVDVRVQLVDGRFYTPWPTHMAHIEQRYKGIDRTSLRTYTPLAFVCAKTSAWTDATRNAPRDLYDLWALSTQGWINAEAAQLYKSMGPTGSYPFPSLLPSRPPSPAEWQAGLAHQCRVQVEADEAYDVVKRAWANAVQRAAG